MQNSPKYVKFATHGQEVIETCKPVDYLKLFITLIIFVKVSNHQLYLWEKLGQFLLSLLHNFQERPVW